MIPPVQFAFQAEYRADKPAYDEFDEFLRIEVGSRHPAWELQFGQQQIDADLNSYNYSFVLTGGVPEATTAHEAEAKIRELLDRIRARLHAVRPKAAESLPSPSIRVWRRSGGDDGAPPA